MQERIRALCIDKDRVTKIRWKNDVLCEECRLWILDPMITYSRLNRCSFNDYYLPSEGIAELIIRQILNRTKSAPATQEIPTATNSMVTMICIGKTLRDAGNFSSNHRSTTAAKRTPIARYHPFLHGCLGCQVLEFFMPSSVYHRLRHIISHANCSKASGRK